MNVQANIKSSGPLLNTSRLSSKLNAVLAEVRDPRTRIEGAFSEMGANLVGASGRLREISATLEEISKELEVWMGDELRDRLTEIKTRAHAAVTVPERRITEVPAITRTARSLSGPLSSLRDTIRAISLVAVPLRIASTDFNSDENSFDVFTSEVTRLANEADNALAAFTRTYQSLIERLEDAMKSSDLLAQRNREAARLVSSRIEASLSKVVGGGDRVFSARREIEQRFSVIQGALGTTVSAIQFGDIARQRIEHIEEGLGLALGTLSDIANGTVAGDDFAKRAGFLAAVCRLQSDQTRDTMVAFDEGAGALTTLLRELAEGASGIVGQSENIREAVIDTSRTVQHDVGQELVAVAEMLRDSETQRQRLDAAVQSVIDTMSLLFEQLEPLRVMRSGVHLLSLNMALRCAQLGGKGRSIRAIAQELSGLSASTVAQVSSVISILQQASALAGALVANDGVRTEWDRDAQAVREAIAKADVRCNLEDLERSFAKLRRNGIEIASFVHGAVLRAQIQPEITSALNSAHISLKDLREEVLLALPDVARGELEAHELGALEELRKSYTMMSERMVHDKALGGVAAGSTAAAAETVDDIFF